MPDWGVPDWLDVAQYPRHEGPSAGVAWAWEFLRRSKDYRDFWTCDVLPFVMPDGSIDVDASIGKYRSTLPDGSESSWGVVKEAADRFGLLAGPRDPSSSAAGILMDGNAIRQIWPSRHQRERRVRLAPGEVGYVFDLSRPLEPQFERALQNARGLQSYRIETGDVDPEPPARARPEKYVTYLRLLDAVSAGADRQRIEAALFPNLDNEYPSKRAVAFNDARRAAWRLRDGGYRALAALEMK